MPEPGESSDPIARREPIALESSLRRSVLNGGVLFVLSVGRAFAASRPTRIGYLELVGAPDGEALFRDFVEAMRDAGLIEGGNLVIVRRSAAGRNEALRNLARELVDANVEVIVAASTEAARAGKHAAPRTAVVFMMSGDPVFEGFVTTLSRPGGNLTGITTSGADLTGKRLQILKEAFPATRTVAVVGSNLTVSRLAVADSARRLQIETLQVPINEARDHREAAAAIARSAADAVLVVEEADSVPSIDTFVRLMMATRRPVMFTSDIFAEKFGLMSFGVSVREQYRRVAAIVARVIGGAKPADIAVEQPSRYELVVNLRAAEEYAIRLPREFLLRADRIIH